MNKKGTLVLETGFALVCVLGLISAVIMTPSFRVRKANEQCVAEGNSAEACKGIVSAMSKAEVLDYIRDDEMPAPRDNHGNI